MRELKKCVKCGGCVSRKMRTVPITVGSRKVEVTDSFAACGACGEVYFAPGEMDAAMCTASAQVRNELGLLQPEEIRTLRESFNLTQAQLETLLGAGEKTVVRWEKGTVFQNKATDTLLRVLRDVPATVTYLMARAGLNQQVWSWDGVPQAVPDPQSPVSAEDEIEALTVAA